MNLIPDRVPTIAIGVAVLVGVILPIPALVIAGLLGVTAFFLPKPRRATLLYLATATAAAALARLLVHTVLGTFLM